MAPWDFKTKSSQSSPKKNNTRPGYVKIAIENDPVEIVDFPMKNGGSFQFAFCKRLPGRVPSTGRISPL